jgi:hypothetical protein
MARRRLRRSTLCRWRMALTRSSVDAESKTKLVGCRTSGIAPDERLSLGVIELPCPPWFGSIGGGRCGGVVQLP